MRILKTIPGIEPYYVGSRQRPSQKTDQTDLPVMLPYQSNAGVASPLAFSHWMTSRSALWLILVTTF